jgi:hypothetical protein
MGTSDQRLVHLPGCCCTELPKACNYEWDLWLGVSNGSSGPELRQPYSSYRRDTMDSFIIENQPIFANIDKTNSVRFYQFSENQ